MNFAESTQYLLSLGNEVSAMKLGLENIRRLLAALGDPQNNYLKIQVAGTNGKGSVCAFLDSICFCANVETGVYSSPHLVSITERIRIGGGDIKETVFAGLASTVRETAEQLLAEGEIACRPTFFEQMTAIALLAFAEAGVEIAILETGLGGRLDATTAGEAEIAVITQIALDHQEYLGDTIEEIAAEKAAIIHSGSKVIVARQEPKVEKVIGNRCREVGVEPVWSTTAIHTIKHDEEFLSSTFITQARSYPSIELGLGGRHQIANAAAAIAVGEVLGEMGLSISPDDISMGLEIAENPGRLEFIDQFLFDGAHNQAGAVALRDYLDEFIEQPITIIFGAMMDKDLSAMAAVLFPVAENVVLTRPDNSRAMTAMQLTEYVPPDLNTANIDTTETVAEAIDTAKGLAGSDGLIVVTGSLYLVGEAKRILQSDSET